MSKFKMGDFARAATVALAGIALTVPLVVGAAQAAPAGAPSQGPATSGYVTKVEHSRHHSHNRHGSHERHVSQREHHHHGRWASFRHGNEHSKHHSHNRHGSGH